MLTFLKAVIIIPIALVAILFAVANRQIVSVSLDPFNSDMPAFALSAPLFLVIILMIILGVLLGGTAAWIGQAATRSGLRQARSEADHLRRDLQDVRLELDLARRAPAAVDHDLPRLPGRDAA